MIVIVLALAVVLLAIKYTGKSGQSPYSLPPGPTPIPFLGNILHVYRNGSRLAWTRAYGDIVYFRLFNREVVILNSEEVATELLEKRSQKYSDRPVPTVTALFGFEWATIVAPYGPRFRLHRRLLHQAFHAKAVVAYHRNQMQRAHEMLTRLLDDPSHYNKHFTAFSVAVTMAVTYGYGVKGKETFVTSMERALGIAVPGGTALAFALCATFPFLKSLPTWLARMGIKSEAAECRRLVREAVDAPYTWVKQRIEEGNAAPSMVADAINQYHLDDDSQNQELVQAIKDSAGSLYAASVETTGGVLSLFIYLMMNHPEVQDRAQAEIDRVVGQQRLPEFEDRASLPYMDAILRETMRWNPVLPFAPHVTTEDDVYRGYYIPKGALIIPHFWAISRDENKYSNPDTFMPERFLLRDGTLNEDKIPWVFGFGRRICPGRHVADASLWCAMVSMLALFRIEKTEGSENVTWETGFTSYPHRFPCRFVPRDETMDMEKLVSLIDANRVEF